MEEKLKFNRIYAECWKSQIDFYYFLERLHTFSHHALSERKFNFLKCDKTGAGGAWELKLFLSHLTKNEVD